jgi:large subunit ribosomal protein L10
MSKLMKGMMRKETRDRFEAVDGGIFISTQGLDSEKTYDLRASLNAKGVKYTVVRNAFVRHAFKEMGYKEGATLDKVLSGPVGLVYTGEENSAPSAARVIDEWKRNNKDKIVQWRGAFMDGEVLGPTEAQQLKDAPTKEQARAQLLGAIQAPITQLLATVREPYARVVYLLNAWKDKREEAGEKA